MKNLTICIPTYNRGKRAWKLIKEISKTKSNIKILVLDNNSFVEKNYYKKIEALSHKSKNLTYIIQPRNVGFAGNYVSCFEMAKTKWIQIISDEDFPLIDATIKIIKLVNEYDKVGIIRGSIGSKDNDFVANSILLDNKYIEKGKEAMLNYGFMNNYISGVIYKRKSIMKKSFLKLLKERLIINEIYPHLFLDTLICTKYNILITSLVLSKEGKNQKVTITDNMNKSGTGEEYKSPYSFGGRLEQFIALRDASYLAVQLYSDNKPFDTELFSKMYISLVDKFFHLTSLVNAKLYQKNNIALDKLLLTFLNFAQASFNYNELYNNNQLNEMSNIISKVYEKYEMLQLKYIV